MGRRRYHRRRSHHKRQRSDLERYFHKFYRLIVRHPLVSSVGSIVTSIILIRAFFSNTLFGTNVTEFRIWFLFFAILIGIPDSAPQISRITTLVLALIGTLYIVKIPTL